MMRHKICHAWPQVMLQRISLWHPLPVSSLNNDFFILSFCRIVHTVYYWCSCCFVSGATPHTCQGWQAWCCWQPQKPCMLCMHAALTILTTPIMTNSRWVTPVSHSMSCSCCQAKPALETAHRLALTMQQHKILCIPDLLSCS